MKIFRAYNGAL